MSLRRFVYSRGTQTSVVCDHQRTHTRGKIMSRVTYTREIEMFGVTVGDCVIVVEYDADDARRKLSNSYDAKWDIVSVAICGTPVENVRFGYNHLNDFETMLGNTGKLGNQFGMAKAMDEIQTLVNEDAAECGFVSLA